MKLHRVLLRFSIDILSINELYRYFLIFQQLIDMVQAQYQYSPYSKIQEGGGLQIVIFAYTKRDAPGVL